MIFEFPTLLFLSTNQILPLRHIIHRSNSSILVTCQLLHVFGIHSYLINIFFYLIAKDDSKSPVRSGGRISVTAPPSRKTSAVNNVSISSNGTRPLKSLQGPRGIGSRFPEPREMKKCQS